MTNEARIPLRAGLNKALTLTAGGFVASISQTDVDREAAQRLRARAFLRPVTFDSDGFDEASWHGVVREVGNCEALVAFRLRGLTSVDELLGCYTGQVYDLTPLRHMLPDIVELGRFCQADNVDGPHAFRLALAAITAFADAQCARMLIGCSSFHRAVPAIHEEALAILREKYLGPEALRPGPKAPLRQTLPMTTPTAKADSLPPLLRSYLGMGGWVSDHAVIDPELDTLHVFTALETARIPEARKRSLRALARVAS